MNQLRMFWVLLLPVVFLLPACQPAATHDQSAAVNVDSVKAQIEGMEMAYAKAMNAKDADGVAVYYASDAQSLASNEPTRVGQKAILEGLKKDLSMDTTGNTVAYATTGVWADGKYAVETGTSTVSDKDGKVVSTGKYMTLFELRDGKYIAIRDIWNSDAPEKAAGQ